MTQPLIFNSNDAFFKYQCKYGVVDLVPAIGTVAQVTRAERKPDGVQKTFLRVISREGERHVLAETPSSSGPDLTVGDLVVWVPGIFDKRLAAMANDQTFGWVGFIRATIAPEIPFRVLAEYD